MSRRHSANQTGQGTTNSTSRRHFLRGLGTAIALPAFSSLGLSTGQARAAAGAAATTATGSPLRAAFLYFPNGAIPGAWWPTGDGTGFQFGKTLEPLQVVRDQIQVIGGLDHKTAEGGPDGPGDHARGNGTFLTGVRLRKSATDIKAGTSIDQIIAQQVGQATRFPSLELACDAGRKSGSCDSGYSCAYQFNLAWSSPTTPVAPEVNPRLAFERLFGTGKPGERQASLARRRQEQRSILDFVVEDARAMQGRLGAEDTHKLDQYLTSVREIESQIERAEKLGTGPDPEMETPGGVPFEYADHIQLMYDMLALAFQTDSTRVATLLLAHDGSNRSFNQIGITEGHHDLSHHGDRPDWVQKLSEIDLWYARHFARFLQKLDALHDTDGQSILHNSMIVYGCGNSDGNRHTHENLPIVLAGRGGGTLTGGRYVTHGGKPMSNLFLSIADRMGVTNLERFGDSTDRLGDV